ARAQRQRRVRVERGREVQHPPLRNQPRVGPPSQVAEPHRRSRTYGRHGGLPGDLTAGRRRPARGGQAVDGLARRPLPGTDYFSISSTAFSTSVSALPSTSTKLFRIRPCLQSRTVFLAAGLIL